MVLHLKTQSIEKACKNARTLLENKKQDLNQGDYEFIQKILKQYRGMANSGSTISFNGLLGSYHFVEHAIKQKQNIFGCINLETIGFSSDVKHSQQIPPKLKPKDMQDADILNTYRTKKNLSQGNFINIICDKNSSALGKTFYSQTKYRDIRLPSAIISLPLTYNEINQEFPDMLRSDHAPFWKNNIPALFITDTANFRYPYYHTEADTIDKLDFEFMKKVCKTVIATVVKACDIP